MSPIFQKFEIGKPTLDPYAYIVKKPWDKDLKLRKSVEIEPPGMPVFKWQVEEGDSVEAEETIQK